MKKSLLFSLSSLKEFGINSGITFIKIDDRVEVSVDLKGKRVSGPVHVQAVSAWSKQ